LIDKEVIVIGAGLAGSEAAWQVANCWHTSQVS